MNEIALIKTCDACPEQYDAYLNGEQVGYLRLRHGGFTVRCPDPVDAEEALRECRLSLGPKVIKVY